MTYSTRHMALATFLRYTLGDAAHLSTTAAGAPQYTFADDGRCYTLANDFFSDDSVTIGNCRELLEVGRMLRITAARAQDSPQRRWNREDGI
jgi:hypothetical protein